MTDSQRFAALRTGAEQAGQYVAIQRDDLLWLLDQAEKKSAAKQTEKPQEPTP